MADMTYYSTPVQVQPKQSEPWFFGKVWNTVKSAFTPYTEEEIAKAQTTAQKSSPLIWVSDKLTPEATKKREVLWDTAKNDRTNFVAPGTYMSVDPRVIDDKTQKLKQQQDTLNKIMWERDQQIVRLHLLENRPEYAWEYTNTLNTLKKTEDDIQKWYQTYNQELNTITNLARQADANELVNDPISNNFKTKEKRDAFLSKTILPLMYDLNGNSLATTTEDSFAQNAAKKAVSEFTNQFVNNVIKNEVKSWKVSSIEDWLDDSNFQNMLANVGSVYKEEFAKNYNSFLNADWTINTDKVRIFVETNPAINAAQKPLDEYIRQEWYTQERLALKDTKKDMNLFSRAVVTGIREPRTFAKNAFKEIINRNIENKTTKELYLLQQEWTTVEDLYKKVGTWFKKRWVRWWELTNVPITNISNQVIQAATDNQTFVDMIDNLGMQDPLGVIAFVPSLFLWLGEWAIISKIPALAKWVKAIETAEDVSKFRKIWLARKWVEVVEQAARWQALDAIIEWWTGEPMPVADSLINGSVWLLTKGNILSPADNIMKDVLKNKDNAKKIATLKKWIPWFTETDLNDTKLLRTKIQDHLATNPESFRTLYAEAFKQSIDGIDNIDTAEGIAKSMSAMVWEDSSKAWVIFDSKLKDIDTMVQAYKTNPVPATMDAIKQWFKDILDSYTPETYNAILKSKITNAVKQEQLTQIYDDILEKTWDKDAALITSINTVFWWNKTVEWVIQAVESVNPRAANILRTNTKLVEWVLEDTNAMKEFLWKVNTTEALQRSNKIASDIERWYDELDDALRKWVDTVDTLVLDNRVNKAWLSNFDSKIYTSVSSRKIPEAKGRVGMLIDFVRWWNIQWATTEFKNLQKLLYEDLPKNVQKKISFEEFSSKILDYMNGDNVRRWTILDDLVDNGMADVAEEIKDVEDTMDWILDVTSVVGDIDDVNNMRKTLSLMDISGSVGGKANFSKLATMDMTTYQQTLLNWVWFVWWEIRIPPLREVATDISTSLASDGKIVADIPAAYFNSDGISMLNAIFDWVPGYNTKFIETAFNKSQSKNRDAIEVLSRFFQDGEIYLDTTVNGNTITLRNLLWNAIDTRLTEWSEAYARLVWGMIYSDSATLTKYLMLNWGNEEAILSLYKWVFNKFLWEWHNSAQKALLDSLVEQTESQDIWDAVIKMYDMVKKRFADMGIPESQIITMTHPMYYSPLEYILWTSDLSNITSKVDSIVNILVNRHMAMFSDYPLTMAKFASLETDTAYAGAKFNRVWWGSVLRNKSANEINKLLWDEIEAYKWARLKLSSSLADSYQYEIWWYFITKRWVGYSNRMSDQFTQEILDSVISQLKWRGATAEEMDTITISLQKKLDGLLKYKNNWDIVDINKVMEDIVDYSKRNWVYNEWIDIALWEFKSSYESNPASIIEDIFVNRMKESLRPVEDIVSKWYDVGITSVKWFEDQEIDKLVDEGHGLFIEWLTRRNLEWKNVEFIDVGDLSKFQEFDRRTTPWLKTIENIEDLKSNIKTNGIQEPLILAYYKWDSTALLIEWNTRLTVAKELWIKEFPVKVVRYEWKWPANAIKVKKIKWDIHWYVPEDLLPSNIWISSVSKKEYFKEADKLYKKSIELGKKKLKNIFGDNIESMESTIWRYGWENEPTISLKLKKVDESDIDKLVELSEKWFKQNSFYVAEKEIWNPTMWIIDKNAGLSYEPWITIYTKKKITLDKFSVLDKMFGDLEIYGATVLPGWKWVKIYNLSAYWTDYEWFIKRGQNLIERLKADDLFWVSWKTEEGLFKIRHIGIDWNEGLWTYEGWRAMRWGEYTVGKKVETIDDILSDIETKKEATEKFMALEQKAKDRQIANSIFSLENLNDKDLRWVFSSLKMSDDQMKSYLQWLGFSEKATKDIIKKWGKIKDEAIFEAVQNLISKWQVGFTEAMQEVPAFRKSMQEVFDSQAKDIKDGQWLTVNNRWEVVMWENEGRGLLRKLGVNLSTLSTRNPEVGRYLQERLQRGSKILEDNVFRMWKANSPISVEAYLKNARDELGTLAIDSKVTIDRLQKIVDSAFNGINEKKLALLNLNEAETKLYDELRKYRQDIKKIRGVLPSELSKELWNIKRLGSTPNQMKRNMVNRMTGQRVLFDDKAISRIKQISQANIDKNFERDIFFGGLFDKSIPRTLSSWTTQAAMLTMFGPQSVNKVFQQGINNIMNAKGSLDWFMFDGDKLSGLIDYLWSKIDYRFIEGSMLEMTRANKWWKYTTSKIIQDMNVLNRWDKWTKAYALKSATVNAFYDMFEHGGTEMVDNFLSKIGDMQDFLKKYELKEYDLFDKNTILTKVQKIAESNWESITDVWSQYDDFSKFYGKQVKDIKAKMRANLAVFYVTDNIPELSSIRFIENNRFLFALKKRAFGKFSEYGYKIGHDVRKMWVGAFVQEAIKWNLPVINQITSEMLNGMRIWRATQRATGWEMTIGNMLEYLAIPATVLFMTIWEALRSWLHTTQDLSEVRKSALDAWANPDEIIGWFAPYAAGLLDTIWWLVGTAFLFQEQLVNGFKKSFQTANAFEENKFAKWFETWIKYNITRAITKSFKSDYKWYTFYTDRDWKLGTNILEYLFNAQWQERRELNREISKQYLTLGIGKWWMGNVIKSFFQDLFPKFLVGEQSSSIDQQIVLDTLKKYVKEKWFDAFTDEFALTKDTERFDKAIGNYNLVMLQKKLLDNKDALAKEWLSEKDILNMPEWEVYALLIKHGLMDANSPSQFFNDAISWLQWWFGTSDATHQATMQTIPEGKQQELMTIADGLRDKMESKTGKQKPEGMLQKMIDASSNLGTRFVLAEYMQALNASYAKYLKKWYGLDHPDYKMGTPAIEWIREIPENEVNYYKDLYTFENELAKESWKFIGRNPDIGVSMTVKMLSNDKNSPTKGKFTSQMQNVFEANWFRDNLQKEGMLSDNAIDPVMFHRKSVLQVINNSADFSFDAKVGMFKSITNLFWDYIKNIDESIPEPYSNTVARMWISFAIAPFLDEIGKYDNEGVKKVVDAIGAGSNVNPLISMIDSVTSANPADVKAAFEYASGFNLHPGDSGWKKLPDAKIDKAKKNTEKLVDSYNVANKMAKRLGDMWYDISPVKANYKIFKWKTTEIEFSPVKIEVPSLPKTQIQEVPGQSKTTADLNVAYRKTESRGALTAKYTPKAIKKTRVASRKF